jgi:transferase hexapaptide repeat protein
VGKNCIIGAGALVPEGKIIPDDSLVVGVPGKIIKQVSSEQAAASLSNAAHYVGEGRRHAAALRKEEKGENE